MHLSSIAAVCHAANREYQTQLGQIPSPPWESAPEWQRKSAVDGVHSMIYGGVNSPEGQWEAWKADKLRDGWRYGPVKNGDTKEHPCLVATYAELPVEERRKDNLFRAVVHALIAT